MGIGTSKGAFYEDEFHYQSSVWDPKYDPNDDKMVVTPPQVEQNKQLEQQDYSVMGGIDVNYKAPVPQLDTQSMFEIKRGGPPIPEPEVYANVKGPEGQNFQITSEDRDKGIDVAMSFGTGTMAGVKSALIKGKLADLGHAQILESNGVAGKDIATTTGFFRGADGKWRHEIPDGPAKLDTTWIGKDPDAFGVVHDKLKNIIDHPELFKHYPELADLHVKHDPKMHPTEAAYDSLSNDITFGSSAAQDKGTVMHEVQHAIQEIEGFAKGGTFAKVGQGIYDLKLEGDFAKYMSGVEDRFRSINESYKTNKKLSEDDLNWIKNHDQTVRKYGEYRAEADKEARRNYLRLAGETEARNVYTRAEMTPKEARSIPPHDTQDLQYNQQIVIDRPSWTTAYGAMIDDNKFLKAPDLSGF